MADDRRLKQATSTLRSIEQDLKRLASDHPDPQARSRFQQQQRRVQDMLSRLERVPDAPAQRNGRPGR